MPPLASRDLDFICERTAPLWESFRNERIFITGGTGFFGCWLLESFAAANRRFDLNAKIMVLTRSPCAFRERLPHLADNPAISLLEGDVRDFRFPEGEFYYVIHAAADVGDARTSNPPLNTLSTLVDGTRRTLDFASSHGTRKFLMVSSGAVYGPQPVAISHIPESYAGGPNPCLTVSAYAEGKRTAEALCAAYAGVGDLECKIARCFAFVGPHLPLDRHFAIGNFIASAMASRPIEIKGDGGPTRSYLYAVDLVVWFWTILERAPSMHPINVGSQNAISIRELAKAVADVLAPGLEVRVAEPPKSGALPSQYVPCVQRAAEQLGLHQTIDLADAIQRTAMWHGWKGSTN